MHFEGSPVMHIAHASRRWLSCLAALACLGAAPSIALAASPITPKDVVYQIITDRFVDGDTGNNIPPGFDASLFDDPDSNGRGNGNDLKLYQGGDWQGIIDKIPY